MKKYTSKEILETIDDVSRLITDTYFEKMNMSDIAILTMFIFLLRERFKLEENDANK